MSNTYILYSLLIYALDMLWVSSIPFVFFSSVAELHIFKQCNNWTLQLIVFFSHLSWLTFGRCFYFKDMSYFINVLVLLIISTPPFFLIFFFLWIWNIPLITDDINLISVLFVANIFPSFQSQLIPYMVHLFFTIQKCLNLVH